MSVLLRTEGFVDNMVHIFLSWLAICTSFWPVVARTLIEWQALAQSVLFFAKFCIQKKFLVSCEISVSLLFAAFQLQMKRVSAEDNEAAWHQERRLANWKLILFMSVRLSGSAAQSPDLGHLVHYWIEQTSPHLPCPIPPTTASQPLRTISDVDGQD